MFPIILVVRPITPLGVKKRKVIAETISRSSKAKPTIIAMVNVWDEVRIRITVTLSLILQIILILLGNKRKVSSSNILRIVLWLSYTAADSVAIVSLSILSGNPEDFLIAWAPLILMHFGGRDTITAYSLQDNNS